MTERYTGQRTGDRKVRQDMSKEERNNTGGQKDAQYKGKESYTRQKGR